MIRRLREKTFAVITENGDNYYLDKFVIFNTNKYYLNDFYDKIIFYEIALSIIDKLNINEEIKKYFKSMLSAISSTKDLFIPDFSDNNFDFDKTEYIEKIKQVSEDFYKNKDLNEDLFSMFSTEAISLEKYKLYSKDNNSQEETEQKETKLEFSKILYTVNDNCIQSVIPEDLCSKYNTYIAGFIKNNTNNFYNDLFAELIDAYSTISLSKSCMAYNTPYITEEKIHVEVANSVNNLIQTMTYLKNSTSFRNNELFSFDKFEIENRMALSKCLINRAVDLM